MSRIQQLLNHRWKFCLDQDNLGLQEHWYEKGIPYYSEVMIPHTFNIEPQSEEYRGTSWYEYHFTPESEWNDKKIRIQFNGIYRDSDFWINGTAVGSHYHSGFTTFIIDTQDTIISGQENILTVRVQNHYSADALPYEKYFDWADDGGIFREAKFIITGYSAINYVQIFAVPQINSSGQRQNEASANFSAAVSLCPNRNSDKSRLSCSYQIFKDCDNNPELIYTSKEYHVTEMQSLNLPEITLNDIKLWHFDCPQLYTLSLILKDGDSISDQVITSFGFRELKTEGSRFILNGEPVRLTGTEWMPGSNPAYGNAEPKEYLYKILVQLKKSNCIFTRFHWQQDDAIYDWCDKNGMLVQEEIPNWGSPKEPSDLQMQISKQQADEMIQSHCNHPSIIAWGMGNELNGQSPQTASYMIELKKYFKHLDPKRIASYTTNTMWQGAEKDATRIGDMMMVNEYIGTWQGNLDAETELTKAVSMNPNKPIVISEFGLCEPAFSGGDQKRSELFQCKMKLYRKYPEIGGIINFCLNDYRTQMGEEGKGALRRRVHGSTDIFGEPKPSYYIVQEYCSPIRLINVNRSGALCSLTLQCVDDLPCYRTEGYYIKFQNKDLDNIHTESIPALNPGESYTVNVSNPSIEQFSICRPNGSVILERYIQK